MTDFIFCAEKNIVEFYAMLAFVFPIVHTLTFWSMLPGTFRVLLCPHPLELALGYFP